MSKLEMKLPQTSYLKKVVSMFCVKIYRTAYVPLSDHFKMSSDRFIFKLSNDQCLSSAFEKEDMMYVPFCNDVGSVMYAMICSRPDLSHFILNFAVIVLVASLTFSQ